MFAEFDISVDIRPDLALKLQGALSEERKMLIFEDGTNIFRMTSN